MFFLEFKSLWIDVPGLPEDAVLLKAYRDMSGLKVKYVPVMLIAFVGVSGIFPLDYFYIFGFSYAFLMKLIPSPSFLGLLNKVA